MSARTKHDRELIWRMKFDQRKTAAQISRELGIHPNSVSQIIRDAPQYLPNGRGGASEAWVTEDGIIDEVAIRRAVLNDGCPVRVTRNEAKAIIGILFETGHSDRDMARRIGVTDMTVLRIREELGLIRETSEDDAA